MTSSQKHKYMRAAIIEAQRSKEEIGCGTVIVKDGEIIASGYNQQRETCDQTAHAEILAIRIAGKTLNSKSLVGCEVFCTCEPCIMCLAALSYAQINTLYFGLALREVYEPARIIDIKLQDFLNSAPRKFEVEAGVLLAECRKLLISPE